MEKDFLHELSPLSRVSSSTIHAFIEDQQQRAGHIRDLGTDICFSSIIVSLFLPYERGTDRHLLPHCPPLPI